MQHLILQIIGTMRTDIFMKLIMPDLLHLDKLHILIPLLQNNLPVHQPRLLHRDDLVRRAVHHQHLASDLGDMVDVGEMVLLEFYVDCVLVVEHAGEGTDWALENAGSCGVF